VHELLEVLGSGSNSKEKRMRVNEILGTIHERPGEEDHSPAHHLTPNHAAKVGGAHAPVQHHLKPAHI